MNWFIKALSFKVMSVVPGGASLYRYVQWNWTKSIVATKVRVGQKIDVGMSYINWLLANGFSLERIRKMRHLDLGAGWHPSIPLLFYRMGMRNQVLADVAPLLSRSTFVDALSLCEDILSDTSHEACQHFDGASYPQVLPSDEFADLTQKFSMTYHAPYFDWVSESSESVDLVTCTQVFMHLDREILESCFAMMFRVLKPGGIFMSPVHLFDIYSNSDSDISIYNHLKYSSSFWNSVVNSELMPFGRLKSPDFREALEKAGFEILTFDITRGSEEEKASLKDLPVHSEFSQRYDLDVLSEKHLFFVARKP